MDHKFFNQLIEDITVTLGLHQDSIPEDFHNECFCGTPEVIGKCYYCQMKENIFKLSESIKILNDYTSNTSNLIQLIDAEAFRYTLDHSGQIQSVNCYPIFNDLNAEVNYPDSEPHSFAIDATTSRFTMNGNGFHIGYEVITYQWKAIKKDQLGITSGLPYLLSRWVINPNEYEIIKKDLPDNEFPDPIDSHDPECEFKGQSFDQCDCADNWDGYFQPEDDFFDQEAQSIISNLNYPEATFNSSNREWWLGDCSFNLNEYETIKEYKDSCDQDNGMPFTG